MNWFHFLLGLILLFSFERLREITNFQGWFENSIFFNMRDELKNLRTKSKFLQKHLTDNKIDRIYKWFESKAVNKFLYVTIFGKKIPTHPIMYDAYHFFKNMMIASAVIIFGWELGIWWIIGGLVLSWIIQEKVILRYVCPRLAVKKDKE